MRASSDFKVCDDREAVPDTAKLLLLGNYDMVLQIAVPAIPCFACLHSIFVCSVPQIVLPLDDINSRLHCDDHVFNLRPYINNWI